MSKTSYTRMKNERGDRWGIRASYYNVVANQESKPPTFNIEMEIRDEVERARTKFPGNRYLLAALMEEVGELSQAMLQKKSVTEIVREAIQVACVAIRIAEEGDATFDDIADHEALA